MKSFHQVSANGYCIGQNRIISIKNCKIKILVQINPEMIGFWNKENQFVYEKGEYELMIGSSSTDVKCKVNFMIE